MGWADRDSNSTKFGKFNPHKYFLNSNKGINCCVLCLSLDIESSLSIVLHHHHHPRHRAKKPSEHGSNTLHIYIQTLHKQHSLCWPLLLLYRFYVVVRRSGALAGARIKVCHEEPHRHIIRTHKSNVCVFWYVRNTKQIKIMVLIPNRMPIICWTQHSSAVCALWPPPTHKTPITSYHCSTR